jgi:hypothetical protein
MIVNKLVGALPGIGAAQLEKVVAQDGKYLILLVL